jgi:hypothetical protein
MGTRPTDSNIEKPVTCNICGLVPTIRCDWNQGRCPHIPSLFDCIMRSTYKTRFYNLIKFITGKK